LLFFLAIIAKEKLFINLKHAIMKKKLQLLTLFIASFISHGYSQAWSAGKDILHAIRGGNIASYTNANDSYLFIVSGRDAGRVIQTTQRYTVSTNTWDTLAPHSTGLLGGAITTLNNSIYVIGGVINPPGFGQDTVHKFDILQNKWSTVAPYPYAIVDAKAVSYQDSLIYTAGGFGDIDSACVMLYNSNTNSWRKATTIPAATSLNFGGFARAGDKLLYVCGTDGFGSSNYFNTVYIGTISQQNRAHITWKTGTAFPGQTRSFFDAHTWMNNCVIMTGGSTNNSFDTWSDECYVFNPANETWTQLPNKPTAWLTGQSGTVKLANNSWELICAGGFNEDYITKTELLKQETAAAIDENENTSSVTVFQNIPNPFKSYTTITYQVNEKNEFINITVYGALGQVVDTLVNEKQTTGVHAIQYNSSLKAGIYYYKVTAGRTSQTLKMICIE
jgi:N-acetylneuraminic acid mutarotase